MLLTICIPTYNRADFLKETLNRICKSLSFYQLGDAIEVLIGDNSSTDETESVCSSFCANRNFRYIKNSVNFGCEKNWFNLVHEAQGKFVWILSDDDFFDDKIMCTVAGLCHQNYSVIYLDYFVEERELISSSYLIDFDKYKESYSVSVGSGAREFFSSVGFSSSFLSSNVFHREKFLKNEEIISKYINNPWLQLYTCEIMLEKQGLFKLVGKSGLVMGGESLRDSRARAADQGFKHYYFCAHQKKLDFYFYISEKYGVDFCFDFLSDDFCQILIEKVLCGKIACREDYFFWLRVAFSRIKDRRFLRIRFYLVNLPLMLLPSFSLPLLRQFKKLFHRV